MSRMTAYRMAALTVVAPLLTAVWAAAPAQAHGAPTDPVSRVYACSPEGGRAATAACRAAITANGTPFTAWDNLRIANVNGRDRQTVPDGELCSGGLPAYKGLDLARADWPSTHLTPGATLTMKYASTIPHTGSFKLYLTKPGYDPTKPLAWSDLPEKPFATVKDPALTGGAYRIRATLPSDRTGRHVLYTIWQNTSTPDTYYSCSDVVFPATKSRAEQSAKPSPSPSPSATASAKPSSTGAAKARTTSSPTPSAEPRTTASGAGAAPVAATETAGSGPSAPMVAGGAAAVLVLTGGAALALRLRRR
ncbi:lytic polysaccharide monooxygenase [Streptomyces sp. NPDC057280]|uniref:lytic polysaccharide monooxygenase n=1 Tax=Streptomyces sp. NPDC057280 TaxID=3346081 RepID=UPI0036391CDC